MERANSLLSEAVQSARSVGERGLAADAAVALSYLRLLAVPETSDEEVARDLEHAIRVFEGLGDEARLARALGVAGILRYWQGEAVAAGEDLKRAARYARDVGDRAQEAQSLLYVLMAIAFGPTPVAEGLERVEDFRPRAEGNRRFEVTLLRAKAQLEAMRGRVDPARELIAKARVPAAERELRPAWEALERMGNWGNLTFLAPELAEALLVQGRDEEAIGLTELTERIANPWDALAARTDFLDDRARAVADLAEVLRLAGRPKESAAALEEAIGLHERKGNVVAAKKLRALLAEPPISV